jgi:hypothetical protein
MENQETPNIFKYATSELSQDAMICYILEWAKIESKSKNEKLHKLGIDFLDSLFAKFYDDKKLEKYEKITIKTQYPVKVNTKNKFIDILCIVDDFVFIIEDKTNTKNSKNQLENYLAIIKTKTKSSLDKDREFKDKEVLPIYFKTGDQGNYDDVKKAGYKAYLRKDFLKVLEKFSDIENTIIKDYILHLQKIELEVNSYKNLPVDKWISKRIKNPWKGFFMELQKKENLNEGNWKEVPNGSGGFVGFWWQYDNVKPYLQIEEERLFIKVRAGGCAKTRKEYFKFIENEDKNKIFTRPNSRRWSSEGVMTLFKLKNDYIILNNNGTLNFDETLNNLKNVSEIFSDIVNRINT